MRAGSVPTSRVGPVIGQLIRERWPRGDGITVLADKVGCHPDTIDGIVRGEASETQFDLADSLLCALGRWDYWHGQFADIYPTKFVEKCAVPSCGKTFPEGNCTGSRRKVYCSRTCRELASGIRRGHCVGHRHRSKGRCIRGHKLHGDNVITRSNGKRECRQCRNDRDRKRWRDDTEYRTRKTEQIARCRVRRAA